MRMKVGEGGMMVPSAPQEPALRINTAVKKELLARTACTRISSNNSMGDCSICFEEMRFDVSLSLAGCKHSFHKICLLRTAASAVMARRRFHCPLCRSRGAGIQFLVDVTEDVGLPGVPTLGEHCVDAIQDRWANWHVFGVNHEQSDEYFIHKGLVPTAEECVTQSLETYVAAQTTSFIPTLGVIGPRAADNERFTLLPAADEPP